MSEFAMLEHMPQELCFQVILNLNIRDVYFMSRGSRQLHTSVAKFLDHHHGITTFDQMNKIKNNASDNEFASLQRRNILHLSMIYFYYYYVKGSYRTVKQSFLQLFV